MPEYPDLAPCIVCGKPAKTVRNEDGSVFMFGIHKSCWDKESERIAERMANGEIAGDVKVNNNVAS